MREIGGYLELETFGGVEYHDGGIPLNCGTNCLAYLIRSRKIKKLYLPYFCCGCVAEIGKKYGIDLACYSVDSILRPIFDAPLAEGEYLYIVNYYGQIKEDEIKSWKMRYGNVIIDNAQAFFQMPVPDVDTLYTCRKFFGVPDGAYLYTDSNFPEALEQDESFRRMIHLSGRYERSASEFYEQYAENEDELGNQPIKQMSKLTHNLLRAIDYEGIKKRRTENFEYLHKRLGQVNKLQLTIPEGAFMYPLYMDRGAEIRKILQSKKIYIPTLWPDVLECCATNSLEYDMAANILPLPVDQRYDVGDMEYIVEAIKNCMQ